MGFDEIEILKRRLERERTARSAAESILETKSQELFDANLKLKAFTEKLKDQMEQNQAILDNATQGIITVNKDWNINTFNPAAERIFGITRKEALSSKFTALFSEQSTNTIVDLFENPEQFFAGIIGLKKDKTEFVCELSKSLVTKHNKPVLIVLIRDRTRQLQLESRLALARKMESVGQLAAGIAHEINTPVQFIGDNIRFLSTAFEEIINAVASDVVEPDLQKKNNCSRYQYTKIDSESLNIDYLKEEIPEAISHSIEGIERVSSIVQAIKEFSHPGEENSSEVDINSALENAVTVSRNEWKYSADVSFDFKEDLPKIIGFPGELNQVFLNIIVNSAQAIKERFPDQVGEGRISICTQSRLNSITISISDNGCGIEKHNLDRLFEPFFTTKEVGVGTGQGLAITHTVIVEKHLGTIDIDSKWGKGTTFRISLPTDFHQTNSKSQISSNE